MAHIIVEQIHLWIKEVRAIQWSKNILVFIPLIAGHSFFIWQKLLPAIQAFVLLCFFASSVYLLNDILDIESDRKHPIKKYRPLASGKINLRHTYIVAFILFAFSSAYCSIKSPAILPLFLLYMLTAVLYSFFLKQIVILDVLVLTFLYTLRIYIGSVATSIDLSIWLIGFSVLFFLSLAFSKRHSEIAKSIELDIVVNDRRGYSTLDLQPLFILGVCSGFSSITVFIIYINEESTRLLYSNPNMLFFIVGVLIYWISVNWLDLGRSKVSDDPIVNFLTDKKLLLILPTLVIVFFTAL